MRSIRWRLTAWYAVALAATMAAFGTSLYVVRQRASLREVDQRLQLEAELSARYLGESHRVLGRIVTTVEGSPTLDPAIASYFEGFRDFVVLTDRQGRVLFASDSAAQLAFASFERLRAPLLPPPAEPRTGSYVFDLAVGPARYLVRPIRVAGPEVAAVLVAAGTRRLLGPAALVQSMLYIAPLIIAFSLLLGWFLAGRSLRPLGDMQHELEAITDGRGLHRRLAVGYAGDEVARLAQAINRMFDRLERSFAALRRFTADASHELKTPLMVLRAGVERALTNQRTPPESLEGLDESLQEVNRMAELVDSLLTLARADEGRLPLAVEDSDLRELVGEAAETANILAEAAGITVTMTLPDQPVPLRVDRARIRQLLMNLVTNAVKYTPAGGQVRVGLTGQRDTVVLSVGDTGIGIAPGDLPHIFDRFWRADPARSRVGDRPGVGLGLAITKWIAEAHGGSIAVQSRPGRGTVFTVTLPRVPEAAEAVS